MIQFALAILLLAQGYTAPRTPDGQPDLQGVWQVRNTANWDILDHTGGYKIPAGFGVVEGGEIPYLPAALAQKKKNFESRLTADPVEKCYIAGFPRTIYLPYPFQILHLTLSFACGVACYAFSVSRRSSNTFGVSARLAVHRIRRTSGAAIQRRAKDSRSRRRSPPPHPLPYRGVFGPAASLLHE